MVKITKKLGDKVVVGTKLVGYAAQYGSIDLVVEGLFNSLSIAEQLGRGVSQAVAHTNIGSFLDVK